ncbi:MAG: hypothetical protein QNJ27_05335 [Simkaniaceae bacterium]|nr:hypothetical protein [Simkaniaceae bacterium]
MADTSGSEKEESITFQSGDQYIGSWLNNKFEGKGTLTYKEGLTFTGAFVKGQNREKILLSFLLAKVKNGKALKNIKESGIKTTANQVL